MKIGILNTSGELGEKAKDIIVDSLRMNKSLLLCAASGSSPTETYLRLNEEYKNQPALFEALRIIKLDEWGGISPHHPATCESYLRNRLIEPLNISDSRYFSFDSNPEDAALECKRIQDKLSQEGPVDVCILGLGMNGHIAFNEPADYLVPHCHIAKLSDISLNHKMTYEMNEKPTYGLTLGMADILGSRLILFLVQGANKKDIIRQFLSQKITTALPASFLWLHPNVICLIDKESMDDARL